MRVATWNTEWAAPASARGLRVSKLLKALDSEVMVITEGSADLVPPNGEVIDAGNDWGYRAEADRRKVLAWSRSPWREVTRVEQGAGRGRVVMGTTDTSLGAIRVIAACIPWKDCHVRTGRRDAASWAEHLECCAQLEELVRSTATDTPTIVAGDFNQRIPRHRQPVEVFDALERALLGLTVHTGGVTTIGRLIDHIATNDQFTRSTIHAWPGEDEQESLSDHSGVEVDLCLRT